MLPFLVNLIIYLFARICWESLNFLLTHGIYAPNPGHPGHPHERRHIIFLVTVCFISSVCGFAAAIHIFANPDGVSRLLALHSAQAKNHQGAYQRELEHYREVWIAARGPYILVSIIFL